METTQKHISKTSMVLLLLTAILLTISIFVPIWRIDLDAPQYPEGLRLLIHADKIAGNVDIINGLNHYIGMKTLHTEDFIEFTLLPYLIGSFAFLALLVMIVRKKLYLTILFALFLLFGIVAMVDFWKWEYNYGHNLDPNAAIIVPGMAYQPPLIGFKQLLNFGAYSIPAIGGWLFVTSGGLLLLALLIERNIFKSRKMKLKTASMILPLALLCACADPQPEAAKLNSDNCDNCKMTIADAKFVAELITTKGRIYKFDDLSCMQSYVKENNPSARLYITNFEKPAEFILVENAIFVKGEQVGSPMGGNTAAFSNRKSAEDYAANKTAQILNWNDLQHL